MSAFTIGRTRGRIAQSPNSERGTHDRPLLTARDFARLERLASLELPPGDTGRNALEAILDGCAIVACDEIGDDIATLNARVRFRIDGRAEETRILVHPGDAAVVGLCLPVTTPLGLALIGRRAGTQMSVPRRDGRCETGSLTTVPYQPEAARRALARLSALRR